jgi:hypothetical protein
MMSGEFPFSKMLVLLPITWSIPDDNFLLDSVIRRGGPAHEKAVHTSTDRLCFAAGRIRDAHQ